MGLYSDKKVLVIGLGLSGRAAVELLMQQGAAVHGVDRDQNLLGQEVITTLKLMGLIVSHESEIQSLLAYDLIIVSPGVPSNHRLLVKASKEGIEVIGEIELGCRLVKNPILGVTGTNGKTTVTLLLTHVLNECGFKAVALGNVGIPFSQEIMTLDPDAIIVLELSSYQLETLSQKVLDAAVILNVTPDHLDRYSSMDDYAKAKFNIVNCLKENGLLYVEEHSLQSFGRHLNHKAVRTYGYTSSHEIYSDLSNVFYQGKRAFNLPESLRGRKTHDVENLMAAFALLVSFAKITGDQFLKAYLNFKKPSHRIEWVTTKKGVCYYDDSKGTNIDAVIRAVEYLDAPIILIAGGVDKGSPYTPWLKSFKNKVKCVCAIGQAAAKMQAELSHELPVILSTDLNQAVKTASLMAEVGDIVLLSPGCSSFDMFKDYIHRGKVFQQAVKELKD